MENISQVTMPSLQRPVWGIANNPFQPTPAHVSSVLNVNQAQVFQHYLIPFEWADVEYRRAYMEASVHQDLAWQIKMNRELRHLKQDELAAQIDSGQSAVSRIENPEYEGRSIPMLLKIAHAFNCALRVKFIPYSKLVEETSDTSDQALYAAPFTEETYLLEKR